MATLQHNKWVHSIQCISNTCYSKENGKYICGLLSEIQGYDGPFSKLLNIFQNIDFSSPKSLGCVNQWLATYASSLRAKIEDLVNILKLYVLSWTCSNGKIIGMKASTHFDQLNMSPLITENHMEALLAMFWSTVCRRFGDVGLSEKLMKAVAQYNLSIHASNRLQSFKYLLYCELSFIESLQRVASQSLLVPSVGNVVGDTETETETETEIATYMDSHHHWHQSSVDVTDYFCTEFQNIAKILLNVDEVFKVDALLFARQMIETVEQINVRVPTCKFNSEGLFTMNIPGELQSPIDHLQNQLYYTNIDWVDLNTTVGVPILCSQVIDTVKMERDNTFKHISHPVWDMWVGQLMTTEPYWQRVDDNDFLGCIGSWMIRERARWNLQQFYADFTRYNRHVDIPLRIFTCPAILKIMRDMDATHFPRNLQIYLSST